ncbi:hypothetical protein ACH4ZX_03920 [Streptomyces sp. NPDC020490]|uniref:hypothetical protein n=1 Tax=Streptomyces sp. NPDC020490 TaxID=3365078 RepID=UPI0037966ED8
MSESKRWRLWIDDEDRTDECDDLDFGVPALVYNAPGDEGARRSVLGPRGFWIALTGPSEGLSALAHDGKQVHRLKLAFGAEAIPVPVEFHEEWTEASGVRKLFGCLASNRDHEPQWVTESQLAEA